MRNLALGSLAVLAIALSTSRADASIGEQGVQIQGVQIQGVQIQGVQIQGVQIQGVQIQGVQIQGVQIQGVQIQGSQLTGYNGNAYLSGAQMKDAYLQAKLSNNQTVWMYVVDAKTSTKENTLVNASYRSNSDVWLYRLMLYTDNGWMDPCPNDHYGMLMTGTWNTSGQWSSSTTQMTLACSSGVVYKCAHNWGYKPWKGMYDSVNQWHSPGAIRDLHQACVHAARAAYCGNESSFTVNGNVVDMFDNYGFNTPLAETARHGMFGMEAYFNQTGAYEVFDETRSGDWGDVTSGCNASVQIDSNYRFERAPGTINGASYANFQQYLIDGAWQSPQTAYQLGLHHIAVSTSTHCDHAPGEIGEPLGEDCNACTASVCAELPDCCVSNKYFWDKWDSSCVAKAAQVCGNQLWSEPRPFFDDEFEENDSVAAAKNLYSGFINSLWATASDHDFFKFPFGGTAAISYEQAAGDLDLRVWQNGATIATSSLSNGSDQVSVPAGATLEVYGAGTTANVYHLAINGWDGDDDIAASTCIWSDNATKATADSITPGYYAANGVCGGSAAWWKAEHAMKVQVSFNNLAGNLNVASYDANGNLTGLAISPSANVETVSVPLNGTFQVYGVNGASNEFKMTITYGDTAPDLVPFLTTEPYLQGLIQPAGETDDIVVPYAGTAVVSFEHDRGDLNVAGYDRNGNLVALSLGTGDVERVKVPTGGKVRVFGASSSVVNAFSIAFLR